MASVGELALHRPTMTKEDYTVLLRVAEDARNECERVRLALRRFHEKI